MKHLVVTLSLAIIGWAASSYSLPAHAQDEASSAVPDMEQLMAQAIANGAPTETAGVEVQVVPGAIPLESFFEGLEGNTFRAREIVILPGGRIAVHTHDKRPAMVHVLEGEFVEHRSDRDEPVIRRTGDTFFEGRGLVHWSENVSPSPARVLAVDIITADPE